MLTFEDLLGRAAEPALQDLIGRDTLRLLVRVDPLITQPDRLRNVVTDLRDPGEMLLNAESRELLLDLLPITEAELLATTLGLPGVEPYRELKSLKFPRNSRRSRELLNFFSLSLPVLSESEAPMPSTELISVDRPLFSHQRRAANRVIEALAVSPNRVLLHMPTGSGKTRTAMSVIAQVLNQSEPKLVVWLAHSEELCAQACEEFAATWKSLGMRDVQLQRWWGSHELPSGEIDGIVIAGLNKVYQSARTSLHDIGRLAGRVDLVVMDEAHQAIAPTYAFVLDFLTQAGRSTPMLGLSATPGRTWNDVDEDERLAQFFNRKKVELVVDGFENPVDYLVDEKYLARVRYESLAFASGIELSDADLDDLAKGLDVPRKVVEQLADDEQRNLLIVHRAEELLRTHQRLLIFAATVKHARVLATVLKVRGFWAEAVTGETPGDDRARIISAYREPSDEPRILINYGVLTTGFDAPRTSAAIIARPTRSLVLYSQMLGRATRGPRAGGNEHAEVVTVVDTELPGFSSMAESFHNWEDIWQAE